MWLSCDACNNIISSDDENKKEKLAEGKKRYGNITGYIKIFTIQCYCYESFASRNILCLTPLSSTHTSKTYARHSNVSFVSLFTTT